MNMKYVPNNSSIVWAMSDVVEIILKQNQSSLKLNIAYLILILKMTGISVTCIKDLRLREFL